MSLELLFDPLFRVPFATGLLLAALLPAHDLWAPDEPDFAQIVREMQERGSWSLPYLNGLPYSEKPILILLAPAPLLGGRPRDRGTRGGSRRDHSVGPAPALGPGGGGLRLRLSGLGPALPGA